MIYSLRGALPWQGFKAVHRKKEELILEKKREIDAHTLCDGLPREFLGYFVYFSALALTTAVEAMLGLVTDMRFLLNSESRQITNWLLSALLQCLVARHRYKEISALGLMAA